MRATTERIFNFIVRSNIYLLIIIITLLASLSVRRYIRHSRSRDSQGKIQSAPGIVNQGPRFIFPIHCGHFRHR